MLKFLAHGKYLYLKDGEAYADSTKYPVDYGEALELSKHLSFLGETTKGFKVYENSPNGNLGSWQLNHLRREALLGVDSYELCFRYKISLEQLETLVGKEMRLAKIAELREKAEFYERLANDYSK